MSLLQHSPSDPELFARPADGSAERNNAMRWLSRQALARSHALPREFETRQAWEAFVRRLRERLPELIGLPTFPPMRPSGVRAVARIGENVVCERVDVYVDEDYAIPSFVFGPAVAPPEPGPALVWCPGYGEDKWKPAYQHFAQRMARHGWRVLVLDHAPFGETFAVQGNAQAAMTQVMGAGQVLGISQLALRAAEAMRAGEYLASREDVDDARVALAGLCQGGMSAWLAGALDERFCAVAPIASATTFTAWVTEMSSYFALSDASPYPFGILNLCDVDHLHAAIAPRPLLVRANLPDQWWPLSGYSAIESLTRRVYRLYGAEDQVDFAAEVHEHNLTGPFADALERFILEHV